MPDLRSLLRRSAGLASGALEMSKAGISDIAAIPGGLRGDDLDEWDPEYIERTLPLLRGLFGTYFRAEVRSLDKIPADGPALLVGNHSGGLYIADTFVFAIAFYSRFGARRRFHQLAHDVAARLPAGGFLRRYGTLAASHDNARAAFARGAPVLVYPGGDYETFRPSWQSDEVQLAGRHGFVRLALAENVPVVPIVSIGGQETALFLGRGERLARLLLDRLLRIKVLPVSLGPPLGINVLDLPGRLPLPAKITVEVGSPIDLRERFGAEPDDATVYDGISDEMQRRLDRLSSERTAPILG